MNSYKKIKFNKNQSNAKFKCIKYNVLAQDKDLVLDKDKNTTKDKNTYKNRNPSLFHTLSLLV